MRSTLVMAALAGLAVADSTCKQAAGKQIANGGLAVTAPLTTSTVTMGQTFNIQWQPTQGISTVSILLLKGPSTNVLPLSCIVDGIPNSGSYSWSVPTDLTAQPTGYGLEIIASGSGDFQYSTQFGIAACSGNNCNPSSSSGSKDTYSTALVTVGGGTSTTVVYHPASSSSSSAVSSSTPPTTASSSSSYSHIRSHTGTAASSRKASYSANTSYPIRYSTGTASSSKPVVLSTAVVSYTPPTLSASSSAGVTTSVALTTPPASKAATSPISSATSSRATAGAAAAMVVGGAGGMAAAAAAGLAGVAALVL